MFTPGGVGEVEAAQPWWSALLRPFLHYADSGSGVDGGVVSFLYRSLGSGGAGSVCPWRQRWQIFQVGTTAGSLLVEKGVAQDGPGYVFLAPAVGFLGDGCGVTFLRRFEATAPMYFQHPTSGRAESAAAGSCGFNMSWPSSVFIAGGSFVGGGGSAARRMEKAREEMDFANRPFWVLFVITIFLEVLSVIGAVLCIFS